MLKDRCPRSGIGEPTPGATRHECRPGEMVRSGTTQPYGPSHHHDVDSASPRPIWLAAALVGSRRSCRGCGGGRRRCRPGRQRSCSAAGSPSGQCRRRVRWSVQRFCGRRLRQERLFWQRWRSGKRCPRVRLAARGNAAEWTILRPGSPSAGGNNPDVLGAFRHLVAEEPRCVLVWCALAWSVPIRVLMKMGF